MKQGLNSLLFNLTQSQPNHFLNHIFSQFCFIPGEQMSTLWANGDMGLKSTLGQQSGGKNSLTSHKKFTQPNHPLQEKIR